MLSAITFSTVKSVGSGVYYFRVSLSRPFVSYRYLGLLSTDLGALGPGSNVAVSSLSGG